MNENLVAEVFVPQQGNNCKKGQIATGYAVAQNLVLTARHPLFPDQQDPSEPKRDESCPIEIRWRHPGVDSAKWWPVRRFRCIGETDVDAVLLECDIPFKLQRPVYLSHTRPQPHMVWESQGFPRVGGKKENRRRVLPMQGVVHRETADEPYAFHLTTEDGPPNSEQWKGVSGGPVFVNGCILGVISCVLDGMQAKRLKAVPMWRLLALPKFCDAVGYRPETIRCEALMEEVACVLEASEVAVTALGQALSGKTDISALDGPAEVRARHMAKALFALPLERVVDVTRDVHRELMRLRKVDAAKAVATVAQGILPAVFNHSIVETVHSQRFNCDMALLELPATNRTVAEIIMAGAESRPAFFDSPQGPQCTLKPRYSVEFPPNSGFDPDFKKWVEDLETYLEQKLGRDMIPGEYLGIIAKAQNPEAIRHTLLRDRLDFEAREQRTRYIAFLFLDPADRINAQPAINKLKQRYPALVFLDLSTDASLLIEQNRLFQPFEKIINPPP